LTPTPTKTPAVVCICYTVEWVNPGTGFWVGVTNFSYINCLGTTVNNSVNEFFPVDVCAQENTITITIGTGDESATWSESLVDCCIPPPACKYYDVTITAEEIASATGNTFSGFDNVVIVVYTDCSGSPTGTDFYFPGTYPNAICADSGNSVVGRYYQDDINYFIPMGSIVEQGDCP
jgi:hypothetical protein